jgi:Rrf2 family protein
MKFSAQEEYGLRCLIRIGKFYKIEKAVTIPEISQAEGISQHTVGKILRILRLGGFLESERGQTGGYTLTAPPDKINIGKVLAALGGRLFDESFCDTHSGMPDICTNSVDCSIRSLWKMIQDSVDSVVNNLSLKDLLVSETTFFEIMETNGEEEQKLNSVDNSN